MRWAPPSWTDCACADVRRPGSGYRLRPPNVTAPGNAPAHAESGEGRRGWIGSAPELTHTSEPGTPAAMPHRCATNGKYLPAPTLMDAGNPPDSAPCCERHRRAIQQGPPWRLQESPHRPRQSEAQCKRMKPQNRSIQDEMFGGVRSPKHLVFPGKHNIMADYLSRRKLGQGDWVLNRTVYDHITLLWGCLDIDLFASKENKKSRRFCSLNPRDNPYAVDALLIPWHFNMAYAFPPLNLIPIVLRKIREDRARDGNQGKHRVTKRGPALSNPMFTLVTGIVGRWRAVCVTALQRPNSDAAAIRIVVGIAAASLSVTGGTSQISDLTVCTALCQITDLICSAAGFTVPALSRLCEATSLPAGPGSAAILDPGLEGAGREVRPSQQRDHIALLRGSQGSPQGAPSLRGASLHRWHIGIIFDRGVPGVNVPGAVRDRSWHIVPDVSCDKQLTPGRDRPRSPRERGRSAMTYYPVQVLEQYASAPLKAINYTDCKMANPLKQVFNKDRTFRPKRKFEPGTQRFELHKKAQASLNAGLDLKLAVQLPHEEDQNDWVAVHVVDFFNRINLIYGTISDSCTEQSCPVMSGGPKYEYRWQDENRYRKPTALSAPKYMNLLMDWIEVQINNEGIFPTNVGHTCEVKTIPSDYLLKLIKRMPRVCKAVIKAKGGYFEEPTIE
ncbi:unnamed protein product [Ranitomeya imitator]|uniref:MOB kinase activator 3A n=1 Tax=Ranitomeya imitator TaxID=111125 RepID=A0ABN9L9C2_9NEOB|nr:unnamed protein product [Ranitomeya imitator]